MVEIASTTILQIEAEILNSKVWQLFRPWKRSIIKKIPITLKISYSDSSVGIATGYWLYDRDSEFESRQEKHVFLFSTPSRPAMGPTQLLIHKYRMDRPPEVKWLKREADHSPVTSFQGDEYLKLYIHSPICIHVMIN
jgi:hypothetical protein